MTDAPRLSVVIPLHDEEPNVQPLYRAVTAVLEKIGEPWEVVAVDDGSRDQTLARLREIHAADPRWTVLALRRCFGQSAALAAGFDHARGRVVVTMDGDLQNDPEDIPRLLAHIEDHDIVSGWRVARQDSWLRRTLPSRVANALISRVTGIHLHDYGCSLKAYRREVIDSVQLYGELHRFIPAIASWMGLSIVEVPVRHHARMAGRTKYGLGRTMRVVLDLLAVKFLLHFVSRPIQIFGRWGLLAGAAGFAICLYLTADKLLRGHSIGDRPLLLLGVMLILLGAQLVAIGLLGEMLARVYHEGLCKPTYVLRTILRRD